MSNMNITMSWHQIQLCNATQQELYSALKGYKWHDYCPLCQEISTTDYEVRIGSHKKGKELF